MLNIKSVFATAGLALVTMATAVVVFDETPVKPTGAVGCDSKEAPIAYLSPTDVDCIGKARCLADADRAYDLAMELVDNADVDITNRYMAYKHLLRANALLAKGGLDTPADMVALPRHTAELEAQLQQRFRQSRANHHNFMKRKLFRHAARELDSVKAHFPERRSRYHIWAVEKERQMKDKGVYPSHR